MIDRSENQWLRDFVSRETMWLRHYTGKVYDNVDPLNKGRVRVIVYDLAFDSLGGATPDKMPWCWARDKHSMSVPAIGEWVEVYFWNGDRNKPVYLGVANEIVNMIPRNFDGQPTTHVLFESPGNTFHAVYDSLVNIFKIGNQNHQSAARKNDATLSNSSLDSAFWAFFSNLQTYLDTTMKTFLNNHVHPVTAAPGTTGVAVTPFAGSYPSNPTSQTGKINAGSAQILIGDQ